MALNRRSANRFSANIWPGFVDAMTALLLVLMFVLTIFMVVQFVLRDTITGQDAELDALSNELAGLSQALGLEQARSSDLQGNVDLLTATLETARTEAEAQAALIASLSSQTENQAAQIAEFEDQVASLLAQNSDLASTLEQSQSRVAVLTGEVAEAADREADLQDQNRVLLADKAALEQANLTVISEKEALQLALAQARSEIDEGVEAARLAAARREALEALIADLRSDVSQKEGSLADALALLAQTQADLEGSRGSLSAALSAMGNTGTDLSDAQRELRQAQAELAERDAVIAAQGLTEQELRARLDELVQGLTDAEKAKLAEAAAAAALRERLKGAEDELTAMTLALEAQRKEAENTLTLLAAARAEISDADVKAAENLSEAERQAALLVVARQELAEEQEVSLEAQRKVALLNSQTVELRKQLDTLQGLLDFANAADQKSKVQIEALGKNLNTALARVAAEQKKLAEQTQKTAKLEEAERKRLEEEAKDLRKFRSEFFGRLRDVLGSREGIRIVGDRFVFSSEILFGAGSAELGPRGQEEIAKVANIILDVADQIPSEIDWILRVDGHTDKVPLSGTGLYADNWELSQARALSVVKYLISDLGVPAERLAANGFGEFQPIVDGDSPEALALNRRIELKFTEK
ncbi:peptidoglycan -binding protein [Amylibacter sp. IMCC11727]|uniref:peptidoglycan -binding protein n=1 Tax=Amylibacter sp. IMCC11727 TaxID=3039851 RepID=UPI00244E2241|nr:peptidoglycan -binding protein [Amylibacter sp. IMCC11727]WGI22554.1 peptidoglycan -binding protein [Amylibacter sp. IMCC11727]